ncbi:hypothetical protein O6H91_02G022200 [Diphasiastrum complanatum]|uniref:Uncharacterized protein n=1 Tax=Diphasiastrum complanatum TaxID=34168 RepID=A0ACC2EDH1_DIPCM|nr:hypothetical protein O6H91_02G022200 [Diphasiastrum complanatum]
MYWRLQIVDLFIRFVFICIQRADSCILIEISRADMAKKRKAEATGLDEVDRTLYSSFCSAANSISQLYTQAHNQQKLAFHAGERHFTERLCQWLRHWQNSSIQVEEILRLVQDWLDAGSGDEMALSPRHHTQHINSPTAPHQPQSLVSVHQAASEGFEHAGFGLVSRGVISDQNKSAISASAFSSPYRRSIPPFGMTQSSHSSMQYGSGNLGRRAGSILEEYQEAFPSATQDSVLESYNSSTITSHFGPPFPTYDTRPAHFRSDYPYGEHDASMDMHADGDISNSEAH